MPDFRIETDFFGELQVPVDAYYGAQTAGAGCFRNLVLLVYVVR